jgi:DNA repair protein RecN (Recombination protein N)
LLRRIHLQDFVIVQQLDVELAAGFTVLTGETGAGKSILIDALQLALGSRADASVVREGAARADIAAEFDTPDALRSWLESGGFDGQDTLLLRRVVDAQGKSRAWINGSPATVAQLREAATHLVEIHGQHAWQSLTQPSAVRALLDAQAGIDTGAMAAGWTAWRDAREALQQAEQRRDGLEQERERLQWQLSELDKLDPGDDEWETLNAEHTRLSHAQALLDAARQALEAVSDAETSADGLAGQAVDALAAVADYDASLGEVAEVLRSAQAQLQDAARSLQGYMGHREPDPDRLQALDARLSDWLQLARRHRRPPGELPALRASWRDALRALEAGSDLEALGREVERTRRAFQVQAERVSAARRTAGPPLAVAVTQAMQPLGMAGGHFDVALLPLPEPQSFGLEQVELRVAGHPGASARPLAKVASGGELSRLALAIAVTTARQRQAAGAVPTLIFDEIDAGVGGAVGDSVGRLMKQLGADTQVLAVTHLAQVAACADAHFVVAKQAQGGHTLSRVQAVSGEARVAEIGRMLGGERLSDTSRAHAQALLEGVR